MKRADDLADLLAQMRERVDRLLLDEDAYVLVLKAADELEGIFASTAPPAARVPFREQEVPAAEIRRGPRYDPERAARTRLIHYEHLNL
ncbi:hypothetical protein [Streptomyces sp. NBC_00572]|uniref:hypothetical protein n=1 Tax=Streptomyces sp. NBC_00572 TaxID=2903664 RepID=UPI002258CDBC|nr:hypothetical protein [Streptomyces sp. NBC_00572]MCX4986006.1 hypothetical protein [Streptomyces sp. NBC_00572]